MGIFTCVQCSNAARKPLILISRENNQHGFIIYTITNLRLQLLINDKNNLVKAIFFVYLHAFIYWIVFKYRICRYFYCLNQYICKSTFVFSFGNTINISVFNHYIHYLFGSCDQKKCCYDIFIFGIHLEFHNFNLSKNLWQNNIIFWAAGQIQHDGSI